MRRLNYYNDPDGERFAEQEHHREMAMEITQRLADQAEAKLIGYFKPIVSIRTPEHQAEMNERWLNYQQKLINAGFSPEQARFEADFQAVFL